MDSNEVKRRLKDKEGVACRRVKIQTKDGWYASIKGFCGWSIEPYIHDGNLIVFDNSLEEYEALQEEVDFFGQRIGGVKLCNLESLHLTIKNGNTYAFYAEELTE